MSFANNPSAEQKKIIAELRTQATGRIATLKTVFDEASTIADPAERYLAYIDVEQKTAEEKAAFIFNVNKRVNHKKAVQKFLNINMASIAVYWTTKLVAPHIGMPFEGDPDNLAEITAGLTSLTSLTGMTGAGVTWLNRHALNRKNRAVFKNDLAAFDDFANDIALGKKVLPMTAPEQFMASPLFDDALAADAELKKIFGAYAIRKQKEALNDNVSKRNTEENKKGFQL